MVRKIPKEKENPFDNIIIDLSEYSSPFFHKLNFVPNEITTLSNIFSVFGLYSMYHNSIPFFIISMFFSYFFDCLDGHYARKYNMCSEFGDLYDHVSDVFLLISFFYLFFSRYSNMLFYTALGWIIIGSGIVMLLLMGKHIGCQEIHHEKSSGHLPHKSSSLSCLKYIGNEDHINWSRYFGIGTGYLFFYGLTAILMYFEF